MDSHGFEGLEGSPHGCTYQIPGQDGWSNQWLPQIELSVSATVISTSARTVVTQTFVNPYQESLPGVFYSFPLYEGASIVGFACHIGDEIVHGLVKTEKQANDEYKDAMQRGQATALFEPAKGNFDVFKVWVGKIPVGGKVVVEITLVQELELDAQTGGSRYTVPVTISASHDGCPMIPLQAEIVHTKIEVDITVEKGWAIRKIQSPSHPIEVDLCRNSTMHETEFDPRFASVKMRGSTLIDRDFVLTINSDKEDRPCALLETHPTLPNQRALMVSLVPKFNLPPREDPSEIVFVVDQSWSMSDNVITLQAALEVFLKSLPLGVHFNMILFDSQYHALWPRSRVCNKDTLEEAFKLTKAISANMGEADILGALRVAVENQFKDKNLEVLLLTDGQIYSHDEILVFVRTSFQESGARFFALGIGNSVSHSLVNGIAEAGMGFAQVIVNYEELDKKVTRMLKSALMTRLSNVTLDFNNSSAQHEGFETIDIDDQEESVAPTHSAPKPMPLFRENFEENGASWELRQTLPKLSAPKKVQAPTTIPPLYPFIRSTVYLLLSHHDEPLPDKVTLHATSKHGLLALDIPVHDIGEGETIHQLAARQAMRDLEQSHDRIHAARHADGILVKYKWESELTELVERECERLGTRFQVSGHHCSFVGVARPEPGVREGGMATCLSAGSLESSSTSTFMNDQNSLAMSELDPSPQVQSIVESLVRHVIALQASDGHWDWGDELLQVLDVEPDYISGRLQNLYASLTRSGSSLWDSRPWPQILATCLVREWLQEKAADSRNLWGLFDSKAGAWAGQTFAALNQEDLHILMVLLDDARSFL